MKETVIIFALICASSANAGIISKAVQEALEKTPRILPNPSGKVISKNLGAEDPKPNSESDEALLKKLEAIPESIGKASFQLITILHTYHTPGQTKISQESYADIKVRFRRQIPKTDREKIRLPLELHLTCSRYATDLFQEGLDSMKSNGPGTLSDQKISELRKCSKFFGVIKGFPKEQSDGFDTLANKLAPLKNEKGNPNNQNQGLVTTLELALGSLLQLERSMRSDLGSWLN